MIYMFRLMMLVFFGGFRGTHDQEHHLHESPSAMTIPFNHSCSAYLQSAVWYNFPNVGGHPFL
jgi:NADH:ubiquinone oxidoreductase subunit 5 (subunit L)/multisubunit Na+/H+ antiporter MnhA subunit